MMTNNKTTTNQRGFAPIAIAGGAAVTACAAVLAFWTLNAAQAQDAPQAASAPAAPITVALPAAPPPGAVVLYGGKADHLQANWYQRYTKNPPAWKVDATGATITNNVDITSRQEFGDCFLHVEYRTPEKPRGGGNAGVGMMGRYEIQILGDYGKAPEKHSAGALYSQTPARVNASKKAGEWQRFDIIFRAPRFGPDDKVTEQPRATVFQNGVLVQNNQAFTGMTGIQYGEYKQAAKTGPVVLQGDHDDVQFRNVWIAPL